MTNELLLAACKAKIKADFHKGKWSSKCRVFYAMYEDVIANAYPFTSLLNIGVGPGLASKRWNKTLKEIWPSIEVVTNLEIDPLCAEKARKDKHPLINNVVEGDVRELESIFESNSFDFIFWNQGPEHIYREEWADTFRQLELVASKVVYLHCPWGSGYDSDVGHLAKSIRKGEFEKFDGYTVQYHGVEDSRDGGIVSWKIL